MRIPRLLRGILSTAVTWALVWVPVSLVPLALLAATGVELPPGRVLGMIVLSQAVVGAVNGVVFASIVAIAGRRRTFESISMPWIATCGALGGVLFPFVTRAVLFASADLPIPAFAMLGTVVTNVVLGAACAAVSLKVARRAPAFPEGDAVRSPAIDASVA